MSLDGFKGSKNFKGAFSGDIKNGGMSFQSLDINARSPRSVVQEWSPKHSEGHKYTSFKDIPGFPAGISPFASPATSELDASGHIFGSPVQVDLEEIRQMGDSIFKTFLDLSLTDYEEEEPIRTKAADEPIKRGAPLQSLTNREFSSVKAHTNDLDGQENAVSVSGERAAFAVWSDE